MLEDGREPACSVRQMIQWRHFVVHEGLSQNIDVPMADVFQRILGDVTERLAWTGSSVVCDIVVTSTEVIAFRAVGEWRKPQLSIPATAFPPLSDRRKHLHLFALAVRCVDAVADGLEIERVTYKRKADVERGC